jgi:predicted RNA-binding Zn-ribbon protein involved in translation (DUF1610 family)
MKLLENVREVFRALKHREPTKIYCPRCGNPEIKPLDGSGFWGSIMPRTYACHSCGYVGPLVMELEKEEV